MTAASLIKPGQSINLAHTPGLVCAFYSYKGGVGRTMAMANVCALLALKYRVLIIDFDLESPGLERYFARKPARMSGSRREICGLLDVIESYRDGHPLDWHDCLLEVSPSGGSERIRLITAGRESDKFLGRVQGLEWSRLFNEHHIGWYFEELRTQWMNEFDFVLIDSPNGITDLGSICTIHLADVLILFCTTNAQSLDGIVDVMKRAKRGQSESMLDRGQLVGIPILAREDSRAEYRQSLKWRKTSAQKLSFIYDDWLPKGVKASDVLQKLRIPYIPYWSVCEQLAVVQEGTEDPQSLGFAYNLLARLIEHRLDWEQAICLGTTRKHERSAEAVYTLHRPTPDRGMWSGNDKSKF